MRQHSKQSYSLRQEVHEFVRAAETLLSPASLGEPLSKQERDIIKFYGEILSQHCIVLAGQEADPEISCPPSQAPS